MSSDPKTQASVQADGDTGDDYEDDTAVRTAEEEQEVAASKVVHVRSLPRGVVESELASLASPFGIVAKTLIIYNKGQAFLEMATAEQASKLVAYYSKKEAILKGRRVFFQFSNRDEIKIRNSGGTVPRGYETGFTSGGGVGKDEGQDRPNKILLVSIYDCRVPITIDNLYQVFAGYGDVDKIVTFIKNSIFKALIQFRFVESAGNAKVTLHGKNMYHGCCMFQIQYSRLSDLKIKQNTVRSRDFTVPTSETKYSSSTHFPTTLAPASFLPPTDYRSRGGYPAKQPIFPSYPPGSYVDAPPDYLGNIKGSVLLVTNLVEQKVTPDDLFTLFGVYGDVQRVKIFYNKQHTALVQMADPYQASLAHLHLNHVDLYGKSITIIPSKHAAVSLPHPSLQKGSNLARDFSNSPLHRFKYNRSKNFRHICAPGSVLHVSNLADEVTADDLRAQFGPKVVAVQFFKTDRRMAFVRVSSTGEAVNALVKLHNHKLGGKPIKVSFSPKKPAQIEDDSKSGGEVSRQTSSSESTTAPKPRSQPASSSSSSSSSTSTTRSSVPAAGNRSTTSRPTSVPSAVGTVPRGAPKQTVQSSQSSRPIVSQSAHPPQNRVVAPGPSGQQGRSGGGAPVRSAQSYNQSQYQDYNYGYNTYGYRDHKQQG
jgi:hnRNP-L/PTB/hephaestus splicing factor